MLEDHRMCAREKKKKNEKKDEIRNEKECKGREYKTDESRNGEKR